MSEKQQYPRAQKACKHEAHKPIGHYPLMVTQAVEVWKVYEDDAELVVEDRTYPVTVEIWKCPHCGRMTQFDALGYLGEIDYLPQNFVRTHPDPEVPS